MITKYMTNVTVRMPPSGKAAKLARIFMSELPPRARKDIQMAYTLLDPNDARKPEISVKFSKYYYLSGKNQ